MKKEKTYVATYIAKCVRLYRKPGTTPDSNYTVWMYYAIAVGKRKVAQVWSHDGSLKRFYADRKAVEYHPMLPNVILTSKSACRTVLFLLLWDAFGYQTAEEWTAEIAKYLPFGGVSVERYTESFLFALLLEARERRIHSTDAAHA